MRARFGAGVTAAVAVALLFTGCGSDSGSKGSGNAGSSASSAASSAAPPSTLPTSEQTAAATLTADDMGTEWRVYPGEPKGRAGGGEGDDCADAAAKEAGKAAVAASDGSILQRGELDRYVQTVTYQFPDATAAKAFADSRLADSWIECVRSSTEAGLPESPAQTVKLYGVTREASGNFVGQYALEFDEEIAGSQQFGGAYATHTLWQKGPIVVDVFFQAITRSTDPETLTGTVDSEIDAGMTKVLGRVTA